MTRDYTEYYPVIDVLEKDNKPGRKKKKEFGIEEVISSMPNRDLAYEIRMFVEEFDLEKVHSFKDLKKAYGALFMILLHGGTKSSKVRKTVDSAIKILGKVSENEQRYLEIEFPKQLEERYEQRIQGIFGALQKVLTEDQYEQFRAILEEHNG
jgi:hypothetical protein